MARMTEEPGGPSSSGPLHAEEFYALPETDHREELVRGDVVREPLPGFGHGAVAVRVAGLLDAWVRPRDLGRVVDHCGFVLGRGPDTVRGPDVAFVRRERLEAREIGASRGPFFEGAPDLAVEVLSPSNTEAEIDDKVREYLGAGTHRVWIVDPDRESVTVRRPDGVPLALGPGDTLDGGEVLPGFTVRVELLFE